MAFICFYTRLIRIFVIIAGFNPVGLFHETINRKNT